MATITYCKGLPTPASELNPLGKTQLEMFLAEYSYIFHQAVCETANHLLWDNEFNKSQWNTHLQQAYGINSRFYELLTAILENRGIEVRQVNPAYTSLIGLVKYARMYGLASDEAAALAIARRGMRWKEKLPDSITAYLSVNDILARMESLEPTEYFAQALDQK